jgi:hypothetical protein
VNEAHIKKLADEAAEWIKNGIKPDPSAVSTAPTKSGAGASVTGKSSKNKKKKLKKKEKQNQLKQLSQLNVILFKLDFGKLYQELYLI